MSSHYPAASSMSPSLMSTIRISLVLKNPRMSTLMMVTVASLLMSACATPVGEVQKWGISGVEVAELSGEVVDVLCEISSNCTDQCGAGSRQLGIKTKEGMVLIAKDLNFYTGGVEELWPFCNQQIVVNGLFTESASTRMFQIQNVREPDGEWMTTTRFLQTWADRNGKTIEEAAQWYRHDERVKAVLERDGVLGLGLEADEDYFK